MDSARTEHTWNRMKWKLVAGVVLAAAIAVARFAQTMEPQWRRGWLCEPNSTHGTGAVSARYRFGMRRVLLWPRF